MSTSSSRALEGTRWKRWLGTAVAVSAVSAVCAGVAFGVHRYVGSRVPEGYGRDHSAKAFRDCDVCPELIVVNPGTFMMGSERLFIRRSLAWNARPKREVTIRKPFAVGRFEVTFAEWDACVADGGCSRRQPHDHGWGRGRNPVVDVSWHDAQDYVSWLSRRTGKPYRLLTEAEWEFAARAGTDSAYPWGSFASHAFANYGADECCVGETAGADRWLNTSPVGQFPGNRFGIHDMIGNVYEWVQDCFVPDLRKAPHDGSAAELANCEQRVIRGSAWYSDAGRVRSSYRAYQSPARRDHVIGLRVAKSL